MGRKRGIPLAAVAIALCILLLPSVVGQGPVSHNTGYVDFRFNTPQTFMFVGRTAGVPGPNGELPFDARFDFSITDLSVDGVAPAPAPVYKRVDFQTEFVGEDPGPTWWFVEPLPYGGFLSGQTSDFSLIIQHDVITEVKEVTVRVTANMSNPSRPDQYRIHNETFTARIYPSPAVRVFLNHDPPTGFTVPIAPVKPNTFVSIPFNIENLDLYPQLVEVRVRIAPGEGLNPENMPIIVDGVHYLQPLEKKNMNFTFRTPKEQLYYGSTLVVFTVQIRNAQNEQISWEQPGVVIVQGFYFAQQLLWIIPVILFLVALLIFLLLRAKRYYDENVIGKPIPPWRLPEEAARLEAARKSDPREFYLLRYFFMEEEYQSALNWFYSFKKRNKRHLKAQSEAAKYEERAMSLAEPSLTRFDRKADRLTRRYRARQERQRLKLESKKEKLQAKVEQHYEEDFDKDHEKWEKKVEKLKKKANKPWYRAHKKWETEVAKINKEWEKPFRKEKEKADKERAKALARYEKQVKKKDKPAWRDWREAVENAEKENKIRAKEGREPIDLPQLYSQEVGPPNLPPAFKTPPKPKLPPEPKEPTDLDLPPEPELKTPTLETSHYARKARRATKKTERKVRRLERKLDRALAKNERDRVRALAKADRKRNKLIDKRQRAFEPSIFARMFRQTPEHREYRARRKLLKALAKEKLRQVEESEKNRLEIIRVEAQRREAELLAKLIRDRAATVRSGASTSGMRIVPDKDPALASLRAKNQAQLERERRVSEAKLKTEQARIEQELRAGLTEELIKERARSRPPAPPKAEPVKPKKK